MCVAYILLRTVRRFMDYEYYDGKGYNRRSLKSAKTELK